MINLASLQVGRLEAENAVLTRKVRELTADNERLQRDLARARAEVDAESYRLWLEATTIARRNAADKAALQTEVDR